MSGPGCEPGNDFLCRLWCSDLKVPVLALEIQSLTHFPAGKLCGFLVKSVGYVRLP